MRTGEGIAARQERGLESERAGGRQLSGATRGADDRAERARARRSKPNERGVAEKSDGLLLLLLRVHVVILFVATFALDIFIQRTRTDGVARLLRRKRNRAGSGWIFGRKRVGDLGGEAAE